MIPGLKSHHLAQLNAVQSKRDISPEERNERMSRLGWSPESKMDRNKSHEALERS